MSLRLLALGALVIAGLAGCSGGESNVERGNREGILYFGNGTEPQSIDPHVLSGSPEANVARTLFEPLVTRNPHTLAIEPGVAGRWEFNDARTAVTFYLNPEARWSNGDPVTAEDFRWSWERALNPLTGNQLAIVLFSIRNAEAYHLGRITDPAALGIEVIDPHTLHIELEYPNPYALINLSYIYAAPVHRPTVEAHGRKTDRYSAWTRPDNFVGNGPFTLDDWKMQRYLRVTRNPHYWDRDNVTLNGIVFRPIESATTEEKMFRSGQLHATTMVPNSKVSAYREQPGEPLVEGPFMGSYYYMLNTDRPPLDNPVLRRALALAIDREQLAATILDDTVVASANYVPAGMPGYRHPQVLAFDPQRARQLLAEAGYPGGEGFPDITLHYNTSENHRTVAVAVQQMWKRHLNIDVTLANQEWKVYLDTLDERDYEIARMGWTGDIYPGVFLDRLVTGGGTNRMGFSNAAFDDIILKQVRATGSEEQLAELYREAERILLEETPLIPIYTYKVKRLLQPGVEGLPANLADALNFKYVRLNAGAAPWRWRSEES